VFDGNCRGTEPKQLALSGALGLTLGVFPICGEFLTGMHALGFSIDGWGKVV